MIYVSNAPTWTLHMYMYMYMYKQGTCKMIHVQIWYQSTRGFAWIKGNEKLLGEPSQNTSEFIEP